MARPPRVRPGRRARRGAPRCAPGSSRRPGPCRPRQNRGRGGRDPPAQRPRASRAGEIGDRTACVRAASCHPPAAPAPDSCDRARGRRGGRGPISRDDPSGADRSDAAPAGMRERAALAARADRNMRRSGTSPARRAFRHGHRSPPRGIGPGPASARRFQRLHPRHGAGRHDLDRGNGDDEPSAPVADIAVGLDDLALEVPG